MLELLMSFFFVAVGLSWYTGMYSLVLWFIYLLMNFYVQGEYGISVIFMLLSIWIMEMMMLIVDHDLKKKDLYLIFMFMYASLFTAFFSSSMIFFYMGFEMSVIPILLILFGWGYQPDRLEAGVYLILYTVLFSLPLLLGINYLDKYLVVHNFFFSLVFLMAFLVKFPMFFFHLWLPRAHVEAPVFGSMILAGVMLKLGGYGIMKISIWVGDMIFWYSSVFLIFSLVGGVFLSFCCFMQSDMKMLIAYSSVVHMSIVISGLLTMLESGFTGAVCMMIGHGLCSSGLFCVLGVTYTKTFTRSLYLNKGILNIMPICTLWWFLFCSSNLSFPPCLNLVGEILLFTSILSWSSVLYIFIIMLSVTSSLYSIYLFSYSQHGQPLNFYSFQAFKLKDSLVMMLHWVPLNLLILDVSIFSV